MNFYLDFEATRFSNRIISVGCVSENGKTFYTLMKPVNKAKVDYFITELTGITNEMLEDAPTTDEAFNQLFDFIELTNDNTELKYYCYGNTDADFIKQTVKYMVDVRAAVCAQAIGGNLIDFSEVVKRFFKAENNLALRKVYMSIQNQETLVQNHDALEDALMLRTVVMNLYNKCKPEDIENINAIPSQKKPKAKKAPEIFLLWDGSAKWQADTKADENNYLIKCEDAGSSKVKYFNDLTTAALWVIKYGANNISPKDSGAVNKIENNIKTAIANKKSRYNCYWKYSD